MCLSFKFSLEIEKSFFSAINSAKISSARGISVSIFVGVRKITLILDKFCAIFKRTCVFRFNFRFNFRSRSKNHVIPRYIFFELFVPSCNPGSSYTGTVRKWSNRAIRLFQSPVAQLSIPVPIICSGNNYTRI